MTNKLSDDSHGVTVLDREVVTDKKKQRPQLWKVLILNDDFTPMEFVIAILMDIFHQSVTEATATMLQVHNKGVGLAGVYTFEVADTKIGYVAGMARENEFPLRAIMEPEESE